LPWGSGVAKNTVMKYRGEERKAARGEKSLNYKITRVGGGFGRNEQLKKRIAEAIRFRKGAA